MKKLCSIILSVAMTFISLTVPQYSSNIVNADDESKVYAWDGTIDTAWYNREKNVLNIYNPSELAGLAFLVNNGNTMEGQTFVLKNDISLSGYQWTTIGISYDNAFLGVFDGNNHTISGLTISPSINQAESMVYVGLFGYSAKIQNLDLKDISIEIFRESISGLSIGGIVGSGGTIYNSKVSGVINVENKGPSMKIGGIAGIGSIIKQCKSNVEIKTKGTLKNDFDIGGICGALYGEVDECCNYGKITNTAKSNTANVGGIAGAMIAVPRDTSIKNSYNRADIESSSDSYGIVGRFQYNKENNHNFEINNVYNTGISTYGIYGKGEKRGKIEKTYFSSKCSLKGTDEVPDLTTPKFSNNMKEESFALELGDAFLYNEESYPVLKWELNYEQQATTTTTTTTTTTAAPTTTQTTTTEPYVVRVSAKLDIGSLPYKTTYTIGDELDLSGGTVLRSYREFYSDGTYRDTVLEPLAMNLASYRTNRVNIVKSDFDSSKAGIQTISVSYYYQDSIAYAEFKVEVNPPVITTTTTTPRTTITTTTSTTTPSKTTTTTATTTSTTTTKRTTTSTTTTTTTTTKRTTATTTTRKVTSTTPLSTTTPRLILGDVNNDGKLDAVDASRILCEYVRSSTDISTFNYEQEIAADVDGNGRIDSCDASYVFLYYAYCASSRETNLNLQEYVQSRKTDSPNVDVTLSLTQKKLTYDEASSNPSIEIILSAKSSNGATINSTGIHIIYDDRLRIVPDDDRVIADCINPRFKLWDAEKYEANGIFVATGSDRECKLSADGTNLWRFTLVLPSNVKVGDIYPINIVYMDGDLFDNCLSNDTEKLRENAFSHIEQGYIEIIDSSQTTTSKATTTTTTTAKPTTTTSTAQKATTITTTTVNGEFKLEVTSITIKNGDQYTIPINREDVVFKSTNPDIAVVSPKGVVTAIGTGEAIINVIDKDYNVIQLKVSVQSDVAYLLGDVNNDGKINAVDASSVLAYYAMISTNKDGGYTEEQQLAADVDHDGKINAVDASNILAYYAYLSTTKEEIISMEEYTNSNKWEKAYQDKLQEFMNSDAFGTIAPNDSMFDLRDINGDNIPELFISVGTYHAATVQVYSFLNGEIIELFDGGEYGLLSYIPSESYLYENVSYAPGPDRSIDSLLKIYKYDGKTITKVIEFGDNIRGMNNYFTIDGTEVDKNKYDNEKEKYNLPSISLGRNYLFNSDNINNIKYY